VYQFLGFPGTGKFTVATELVRQLNVAGHTAKLLDKSSDGQFDLRPRPPERTTSRHAVERVSVIRSVVLDTIELLSPPDWSFVFTNFLPPRASRHAIDRHQELASKRGAVFVPVVLECDKGEILRRVVGKDRAARLTLVDVARAKEVLDEGMVLPDWPELWSLDLTALSPQDAAALILRRTAADVVSD